MNGLLNDLDHLFHDLWAQIRAAALAVDEMTARAFRLTNLSALNFLQMRFILFLFSLLPATLLAQPAFQLADVHPSPWVRNPQMSGGALHAGRFELRRATMVDLIRTAYNLDAADVAAGPGWLDFDRFDIVAKAPPATSRENLRLMLQTLLAGRFHLAVHRESRPMPSFVLSLGKGKPKLKVATGSGEPGCRPDMRPPIADEVPRWEISCHGVSMASFVHEIRDVAGRYLPDPVIDSTGLQGAWDFNFEYTPQELLERAGSDGVSLFDAVDKQLGLKLEPRKVPRPVVVVDSVNETPTPNPPAVAVGLPPAQPAEFEVAVLKESTPESTVDGRGLQSGGRVEFGRTPLRILINIAYDLLLARGQVQGAPPWFENARYDLVAKAAVLVNRSSVTGDLDDDTYHAMLRKLLEDRLKLKYHFEDQPVTAYTLVAVKPKLKKADPANRTGCQVDRAPGPPDLNGGPPAMLAVCRNISMAQFAQELPSLAFIYLDRPLVDATALDGSWDFSFTFSIAPPNQAGGGGRKGGGGAPPPPSARDGAADPSGVMSLFDAVEKQLGLRLEMQKRVFPVFVIDHIEQKPAGN